MFWSSHRHIALRGAAVILKNILKGIFWKTPSFTEVLFLAAPRNPPLYIDSSQYFFPLREKVKVWGCQKAYVALGWGSISFKATIVVSSHGNNTLYTVCGCSSFVWPSCTTADPGVPLEISSNDAVENKVLYYIDKKKKVYLICLCVRHTTYQSTDCSNWLDALVLVVFSFCCFPSTITYSDPFFVLLLRLWPWVSEIFIMGAFSHLLLSPDIFAIILHIGTRH